MKKRITPSLPTNKTTYSPQETVLEVRHLQKKIGKRLIIQDVSFDIKAGEVFGFLGPNGSGKTTTIRMLVDLIRPTQGTVHICGMDIQKQHEALRYIGCIVENPELYPFLTGWENLEHFAVMLPDVTPARIEEVVRIVGMDHRIHDKVKTYSLGMRQRLGIAQALLGNPRLLILDEPTNGLDPQGIKELRAFIRSLADTGLSLFISSHLLSEIQLMCDRVAIIRKGKVIAVGHVEELLSQSEPVVAWRVTSWDKAFDILKSEHHVQIHKSTEYDNVQYEDATSRFHTILTKMGPEQIPAVNKKLVEAGVQVYGIEVRQPNLEDLFLQLTEGEEID